MQILRIDTTSKFEKYNEFTGDMGEHLYPPVPTGFEGKGEPLYIGSYAIYK